MGVNIFNFFILLITHVRYTSEKRGFIFWIAFIYVTCRILLLSYSIKNQWLSSFSLELGMSFLTVIFINYMLLRVDKKDSERLGGIEKHLMKLEELLIKFHSEKQEKKSHKESHHIN